MKISYSVEKRYLIKNAHIETEIGKVYLITGVENSNHSLIGGIIAKLLPLKEIKDIPRLNAIIKKYTGILTVEDGCLPHSGVYVCPNPERHFLFLKVKEEFEARLYSYPDSIKMLSKLGLNDSFYERQICSLSGGEKMKFSLSLVFSKNYDCYILHSVIPWLDEKGRSLLLESIRQKKKDASIIFIEHETYPIEDVVDYVYEFDGTNYINRDRDFIVRSRSSPGLSFFAKNCSLKNTIVGLKNITFNSYNKKKRSNNKPLIDNISLSLYENGLYVLIGNNGTGKSTLAKIIFRVLLPESGEVLLFGKSLQDFTRKELCEYICYISQFPEQQIVYNDVGQFKVKMKNSKSAFLSALQEKSLKLLNLSDDTPFCSISVYQMKLLLLISSMTEKTKVIILDELGWGLSKDDLNGMLQIIDEILQNIKVTILFITHDIRMAYALKAKILLLNNGKLIFVENEPPIINSGYKNGDINFFTEEQKK